MAHEPGEEYDCDACGASHVVQRGKGLRVAGSSEELSPSLYVRCPEAGFVPLSDSGDESGDDVDGRGGETDDWP